MTEKELYLLNFEKEEIKDYEEDDSYYYALDIVDGLLQMKILEMVIGMVKFSTLNHL
jgi:hypothetical protein